MHSESGLGEKGSTVKDTWTKWHDIPWDSVIAGNAYADRYFQRAGLIRKDKLARFAPSGCHPATVEVNSPAALAIAVKRLQRVGGLLAKGCTPDSDVRMVAYVLKKAHSSNAHEMQFLTVADAAAVLDGFAKRSEVESASSSTAASTWTRLRDLLVPVGDEKPALWILQLYVQPRLHEGRKFHLRALLLCVGDLTAYLHEDVRALIASEAFEPARSDGSCLLAHITNMGINQSHPDYNGEKQNLGLEELGCTTEASRIRNEIATMLGATIASVYSEGRREFFALPNCWELFGVDFLVEAETSRVVLLEINASPSLAMYRRTRQELLGTDPLEGLPLGWMLAPLPELPTAA